MTSWALKAPASLKASNIATRSAELAPTAFMASTIVDNSTPGSKTKARAGCSSTSISVSCAVVAVVIIVLAIL